MTEAEKLLLAAEEEEEYTEPHIVIDKDKNIFVPDELKKIAVQKDHDMKTVTFDCPRYWDGRDLYELIIYINFMRSSGDTKRYPAENVTVDEADESILHFDWPIKREATKDAGILTFLVCANRTDEEGNEDRHWNSERCKDLIVSEGLECGETEEEQYPDLITHILLRVRDLEEQKLPEVTAEDNDKVMQVVDGNWVAADILSKIDERIDAYIEEALGGEY